MLLKQVLVGSLLALSSVTALSNHNTRNDGIEARDDELTRRIILASRQEQGLKTDRSICLNGQTQDRWGNCQCPYGQKPNPKTGVCECPDGQKPNPKTGVCECPDGQKPNPKTG
ncbi:hypothetical protein NW769_015397, partial [Fusarium oxysporum]